MATVLTATTLLGGCTLDRTNPAVSEQDLERLDPDPTLRSLEAEIEAELDALREANQLVAESEVWCRYDQVSWSCGVDLRLAPDSDPESQWFFLEVPVKNKGKGVKGPILPGCAEDGSHCELRLDQQEAEAIARAECPLIGPDQPVTIGAWHVDPSTTRFVWSVSATTPDAKGNYLIADVDAGTGELVRCFKNCCADL